MTGPHEGYTPPDVSGTLGNIDDVLMDVAAPPPPPLVPVRPLFDPSASSPTRSYPTGGGGYPMAAPRASEFSPANWGTPLGTLRNITTGENGQREDTHIIGPTDFYIQGTNQRRTYGEGIDLPGNDVARGGPYHRLKGVLKAVSRPFRTAIRNAYEPQPTVVESLGLRAGVVVGTAAVAGTVVSTAAGRFDSDHLVGSIVASPGHAADRLAGLMNWDTAFGAWIMERIQEQETAIGVGSLLLAAVGVSAAAGIKLFRRLRS